MLNLHLNHGVLKNKSQETSKMWAKTKIIMIKNAELVNSQEYVTLQGLFFIFWGL
jgi:hypothetical protein